MWDNQWAFQINSDFSYTGKTLTQHTNDCWSALLYKHPQTWMSQTAFYESTSLFPPDEYLRAAFISLQHVESSRVANQQNPIVWHRAELLCSFQNFSGMRIFHSCPFLNQRSESYLNSETVTQVHITGNTTPLWRRFYDTTIDITTCS